MRGERHGRGWSLNIGHLLPNQHDQRLTMNVATELEELIELIVEKAIPALKEKQPHNLVNAYSFQTFWGQTLKAAKCSVGF